MNDNPEWQSLYDGWVGNQPRSQQGWAEGSQGKTKGTAKYLLSHAVMPNECPRRTVECSKGAYSLQSPLLQKTQSLSLHKAPHSHTVDQVAMMVIMVA
jgi:hypothetical protein